MTGTDRLYPIHFEVSEEGGDYEGGGEGGDDVEWEGPSQDEWNTVMEFQQTAGPVLQRLGTYLETPDQGAGEYYQPGVEDDTPEFDPYDADSVQQFIQNGIQSGIQEALGPFQGLLGTIASREGESLAKGELDKISESVGEFDKDNAFLIANGMIEQGHDPAQALHQAASYSKQFEDRIRADEREKFKAELATLSGAPKETATGSFSASEEPGVPTGPDRYRVAIARAFGGNGNPVG